MDEWLRVCTRAGKPFW
jgi:hypothetical protein